MEKCGARHIGSWTGDIYICTLKGMHLYHKGYCGGDEREWPNREAFCAQPFPNTNDLCKRPPKHEGLCRVKIHGKTISFKIGKR